MGSKLRLVRKSQNLSLGNLSEKTGLSKNYICELEKGVKTNPSKETMDKIAKALGSTVPELFYGTDVNKDS